MKSNNYEKTAFERILRETERSYFQNLKVSDFIGSFSLTLLAEKPAQTFTYAHTLTHAIKKVRKCPQNPENGISL